MLNSLNILDAVFSPPPWSHDWRLHRIWSGQPGNDHRHDELAWPQVDFSQDAIQMELRVQVPGMAAQDLTVTLHEDVITLSGQRRAETPPGYEVHRRERRDVKFSCSFSLPSKADPEKVHAVVRRGVLQVTLQKIKEHQPLRIAVTAA